MTVDAYRDLIQATADRARVGLAGALQVIADFEKMSARERKVLVEHLAILKEKAAREGMSVARFVTIMLGDNDGDRHSLSTRRRISVSEPHARL